MLEQQFRFEPDMRACKWDDFEFAVKRLEYGNVNRAQLQLIFATGARIVESDNMDPANLFGQELYWKPGKNQKGMRHERLPASLIAELVDMRKHRPVKMGMLLGLDSQTLVRYFDRDCRPLIGGVWTERVPKYVNGKGWTSGWKLCLNSARKTFQTVLFAYFLNKYKEPMIAAQMVAKRMCHAAVDTTIQHYINDYTQIQAERWLCWLNTGRAPLQGRIIDYL